LPVSPDHILWAYRLFLDREPDEEKYEWRAAHYPDAKALREQLIGSPEYALKNGTPLTSSAKGLNVYADLSAYGVNGKLFVSLSDYIGLSVAQGIYELEEVALVKAKVGPSQTIVDIGGNIGFFSVLFSYLVGPSGKVFTIEPVPGTLEYLKRSLAENSFCSNVSVTQAIVTDTASDDIEIAYHPLEEGSGSTGGSYLIHKNDELPAHMSRQAIKADRLDSMIPEGEKVDFIKIDIEGAEPLAIKGAERILSMQSPIIMSEVHGEQLRLVSKTDWRGYFDLMRGYGYRPHFFKGGEIGEEATALDGDKVYNVAFIKA
jgi:FkbM family methyltransferase